MIPDGPDRRWLRPWDGYLSLCAAVAIVLIARHTSAGPNGRAIAVTCLALIAVSWILTGHRVARDDTANAPEVKGARWYVVSVTILFLAAVAADEMSLYALLALCPIAFLCLTLRPALVAVTVLNLAPLPIEVFHGGAVHGLRHGAPIAVLGLLSSVLTGTAIERITRQSSQRARLIAELEASRAEVAVLSHQAGVAAERARLAADIHDTLAQGFTSMITLVQAAESEMDTNRPAADRHLSLAARVGRDNLAEARAMVTVLAPADLRTGAFADVVARQVARLAEETGVGTECTIENIPADLPTTVEVVVIRALQESLANIRKHANAAAVTVDLLGSHRGPADGSAGPASGSDGTVTLTVTDDGEGFDPPAVLGGYGLRGMRARAEQIGGTLTIHSASGLGTTVIVELPS